MDAQNVDHAGDFNLPSIKLHNHENKTAEIRALIQEFNIYESIYKGAITGSIIISDALNMISKLPIQGTERLTFKLNTPGMPAIDCSDETGHPMHIYKLTDKQQVRDGQQVYTLHFCSREFLRNLRTRVSKAYEGSPEKIVNSILADKNYLDSKKALRFQKTRNQDKFVMPNVKPFTAISMLCKKAMAENSKGVGYFFWESSKGFHFRSWENLCVDMNGNPRDIRQTFRATPANMRKPDDVFDAIEQQYQSVEDYKFVNNFHDVAANTALGTYGHRVITHNIYDKSYKIDDYHYHNQYGDTGHADGNNPPIVTTPVDFDDKGISDYPESRVTVMPTTQFAHGKDTGSFGMPVEQDGKLEPYRESLANQVIAGTKLHLTVKGQSMLAVGDVIEFRLISVENKVDSSGSLDHHFSGRYIITKIRHRVTMLPHEYIQRLECAKDSVANAYSSNVSSFPGKKPKNDTTQFTDEIWGLGDTSMI